MKYQNRQDYCFLLKVQRNSIAIFYHVQRMMTITCTLAPCDLLVYGSTIPVLVSTWVPLPTFYSQTGVLYAWTQSAVSTKQCCMLMLGTDFALGASLACPGMTRLQLQLQMSVPTTPSHEQPHTDPQSLMAWNGGHMRWASGLCSACGLRPVLWGGHAESRTVYGSRLLARRQRKRTLQ